MVDRKASRIFIALIHFPVYDKNFNVVTTAVTNLDVHDLARVGLVFGVERYYLVTPLAAQKELIRRICRHWQEGLGSEYNPLRKLAFALIRQADSLEVVTEEIRAAYEGDLYTVATSARSWNNSVSFAALRHRMIEQPANYLILLGTGWGLTDAMLAGSDAVLEPIQGATDYRHLPVRAAAAIMLDRLLPLTGDKF